MINTKDDIWIEGFDNPLNRDNRILELLPKINDIDQNDPIIYWQKTSDIPEEIAKECVEVTATGLFKNYTWSNEKVQDYGMQPISTTAKESIQSAASKEDGSFYDFIIIYKK